MLYKKQCKTFICQVCKGAYHDSCLIRKKLRVTGKTTVLCAECAESTETNPAEMDVENNLLKKNNQLMIQKIEHLEDQLLNYGFAEEPIKHTNVKMQTNNNNNEKTMKLSISTKNSDNDSALKDQSRKCKDNQLKIRTDSRHGNVQGNTTQDRDQKQ
ncbi:hypothetical protein WA026_004283 [Henosepilachna vigintioctopunctata]|uniref:Uncharacterized protein n=1 Tax=Henosepilachna vigintioctopunctata TaxID=420089 RepID=A0AAW1V7A2_9CUCU